MKCCLLKTGFECLPQSSCSLPSLCCPSSPSWADMPEMGLDPGFKRNRVLKTCSGFYTDTYHTPKMKLSPPLTILMTLMVMKSLQLLCWSSETDCLLHCTSTHIYTLLLGIHAGHTGVQSHFNPTSSNWVHCVEPWSLCVFLCVPRVFPIISRLPYLTDVEWLSSSLCHSLVLILTR